MKIPTNPQPIVLNTAGKILAIQVYKVFNTGKMLKNIAIDTQLVSPKKVRSIFSKAYTLN